MGDQYSLTLHNRSPQPNLTFAVYTVPPTNGIGEASGTFPIAWLAKKLNEGNDITFTWTLEFTLMYSTMGAQAGAIWTESASLPVNDETSTQNAALLSYPNGDYQFALNPNSHPVTPGYVYLDTAGSVPPYDPIAGPSVALAIATGPARTPTPAIAGNSGPNLHHTFILHPTYYIQAGQMVQGEMADLDTVTMGQEVRFAPGLRNTEWTFNPDNSWSPGAPR
jgi:hypothetical protein